MRAIIIDDKDCKDLLARLDILRYRFKDGNYSGPYAEDPNVVSRAFRYEVVAWLQDQGWKL